MRKKKKEKLKDIIIDHIYHYCYNEIVKKIQSDDLKLTIDVGQKLEDDPVLMAIYEDIKKSKGITKMFYDSRNKKFCRIIENDLIHNSLSTKLTSQGFKKGSNLKIQLLKTLEELNHKSYIIRNQPVESEFALTQKGINHYSSGGSFEDKFISGRNAKIAVLISIISITIAICSFAKNL